MHQDVVSISTRNAMEVFAEAIHSAPRPKLPGLPWNIAGGRELHRKSLPVRRESLYSGLPHFRRLKPRSQLLTRAQIIAAVAAAGQRLPKATKLDGGSLAWGKPYRLSALCR